MENSLSMVNIPTAGNRETPTSTFKPGDHGASTWGEWSGRGLLGSGHGIRVGVHVRVQYTDSIERQPVSPVS